MSATDEGGQVDLIAGHVAIWREFHEPAGILLSESKADWCDLLSEDPEMVLDRNWGDLAGAFPEEVARFAAWLDGADTGHGDQQ